MYRQHSLAQQLIFCSKVKTERPCHANSPLSPLSGTRHQEEVPAARSSLQLREPLCLPSLRRGAIDHRAKAHSSARQTPPLSWFDRLRRHWTLLALCCHFESVGVLCSGIQKCVHTQGDDSSSINRCPLLQTVIDVTYAGNASIAKHACSCGGGYVCTDKLLLSPKSSLPLASLLACCCGRRFSRLRPRPQWPAKNNRKVKSTSLPDSTRLDRKKI